MNISFFGFTLMIQLLSLSVHPMVWELCLLRFTLGKMGDTMEDADWSWSASLLDVSWEAPAYDEDGALLWESTAKVEVLFTPLYRRDGNEGDDVEAEPIN